MPLPRSPSATHGAPPIARLLHALHAARVAADAVEIAVVHARELLDATLCLAMDGTRVVAIAGTMPEVLSPPILRERLRLGRHEMLLPGLGWCSTAGADCHVGDQLTLFAARRGLLRFDAGDRDLLETVAAAVTLHLSLVDRSTASN